VRIRLQRCVKIAKPSVNNFRRFTLLNTIYDFAQTDIYIFIYIDIGFLLGRMLRLVIKYVRICFDSINIEAFLNEIFFP
jgi:hypothetical protein